MQKVTWHTGGKRGQSNNYNPQAKALGLQSQSKSSIKGYTRSRRLREGPEVNKYVKILRSCVDTNIVDSGTFHVILRGHKHIKEGYYCRIGFMQDTGDEESFKESVDRRLEWSEALSKKNFCVPSREAAVHVLSNYEQKSLKAGLAAGGNNKARLRRFCNKHISAESDFIALYGEMVEAAKGDVREHLDGLNLRAGEGRHTFLKTLYQMHTNVEQYVGFVIRHLQTQGWSSFTFDLKAKNALMCEDGQGNLSTVLCDLDAEEGNCFSPPELKDPKYWSQDDEQDNAFCELFVEENRAVLSLAAFIMLTLNSIRTLDHSHNPNESKNMQVDGGHVHKWCPEYLVTKMVHIILERLRNQDNRDGYAGKIKKLFEIMTSDKYWNESMRVVTHYLRLPRDSPGAKSAWALSTGERPGVSSGEEEEEEEGLSRRRWLLLLFLNIYKCHSCQKPRAWLLQDLLEPMWEELRIENPSQVGFDLSLDFLKQKKTVRMEHNRVEED